MARVSLTCIETFAAVRAGGGLDGSRFRCSQHANRPAVRQLIAD
jgi:hypothetical protein